MTPEKLLATRVAFGKYKGLTWAALLREVPSYVEWCLDTDVSSLSREEKDLLAELLEARMEVREEDAYDDWGYDPMEDFD